MRQFREPLEVTVLAPMADLRSILAGRTRGAQSRRLGGRGYRPTLEFVLLLKGREASDDWHRAARSLESNTGTRIARVTLGHGFLQMLDYCDGNVLTEPLIEA